MLRDKGHRCHDHPDPVARGLGDGVRGRRPQPFHRPDPALVADGPGTLGQPGPGGDGSTGRLDLRLIGIALLRDQALRDAVGREQHPHRPVAGLGQFRAHAVSLGLDPARCLGVAADRPADARARIDLGPPLQRGLRRRGRELGIQRQEDDLVRAERRHIHRGFFRQRSPVAHGDEGAHLVARQQPAQDFGHGRCLTPGFRQQGGTAAHQGVVGLGGRLAAAGDQPCQKRPERIGQADDGRVAEQVEQEGFDRGLVVRPAEIEQHHRDAAAPGVRGHCAPIRFRTCSTWAIGTSGRMPCPRLKIHGPCPQASSSWSTRRSSIGPPARSNRGSSAPWIGLMA